MTHRINQFTLSGLFGFHSVQTMKNEGLGCHANPTAVFHFNTLQIFRYIPGLSILISFADLGLACKKAPL